LVGSSYRYNANIAKTKIAPSRSDCIVGPSTSLGGLLPAAGIKALWLP
jgi:hypothetical protein